MDVIERKLVQKGVGKDWNKEYNERVRGENGEVKVEPYLCNLFVLEEYRRKGLGEVLVREVVRVAKEEWEGWGGIYLHVDDDNLGAKRLYEKEVSWRN